MIDIKSIVSIPNGICVNSVHDGSMNMNCSFDEFNKGLEVYNSGELMQNAFPFLDADEREFLMSGLSPAEFEEITRIDDWLESEDDIEDDSYAEDDANWDY